MDSEMPHFLIWSLSRSTWCIMRYTVYPCLVSCLFYAGPEKEVSSGSSSDSSSAVVVLREVLVHICVLRGLSYLFYQMRKLLIMSGRGRASLLNWNI